MKANEKEMLQVVDFAKLQFTRKEISIVTGIDRMESGFEEAVMKGQLMNEAMVRARVFELAQSGSAPAVIEAIKLIDRRKARE